MVQVRAAVRSEEVSVPVKALPAVPKGTILKESAVEVFEVNVKSPLLAKVNTVVPDEEAVRMF